MEQCAYCGKHHPDAYKCEDCRQWICGESECEVEHDHNHRRQEEERECPECGRRDEW